jgi:hypothetical protein
MKERKPGGTMSRGAFGGWAPRLVLGLALDRLAIGHFYPIRRRRKGATRRAGSYLALGARLALAGGLSW